MLKQTDSGLKTSFVNNYTADLVVKAQSKTPFGLFGANTPAIGEYFSIPVLQNINKVQSLIENTGLFETYQLLISGAALMELPGYKSKTLLFGISGSEYLDFFNGIEIVEGHMFSSGEEGLFMTEGQLKKIETQTGKRPVPGDPVLLTTAGNNGFKIREIPLHGIYTYENGSTLLEDLVLVDAQTLRALNSITLASSVDPISTDDLFSVDSIDSLFGSDDIQAGVDDSFSSDSVLDLLSLSSLSQSGELSGGGWNFILLRLKRGVSEKKALKVLNREFSEAGLQVEVVNWRDAAGLSALLVLLLQILYNGGFQLVVVAGVIAIVNILIISIHERTGEIGTLRAIGATKNYILTMIFIETIILSFLAGMLAVLLGNFLIRIVNHAGITINNGLIRSLLGSSILEISFLPSIAALSLFVSVFLGCISTIFPVKMALAIEPVTAVGKG
jgi:ABC-type antimicrobial peptide transport system permease subunit